MASYNLFIDIERFVKWTYNDNDLVHDKILSPTTYKNWRSYSKFPTLTTLKIINTKISNSAKNEAIFETINIPELIICINNAKDHNRGNRSLLGSISSTEKKILIILLLGRSLDDVHANCFTVKETDKDESSLYKYLTGINSNSNNGSHIKQFKYFPGRTFSYQQLCKLSSKYKNGITNTGIKDGLNTLSETGLISCINESESLYRLEFNKCFEFFNSCQK